MSFRSVGTSFELSPYASIVQAGGLPARERLTDNTLNLPLSHQMTESAQSRVLDLLVGSVRET